MAMQRKQAKVRGVYEREMVSGIWWIQYKQGSVRKREKIGRRSDAVVLYQQRKNELRAGAKLAPNLRTKGPTFSVLAAEALAWSAEHRPKDIRTLKSRMNVLSQTVTQFEFLNWTPADHPRHVCYLGVREDKRALEVVRET